MLRDQNEPDGIWRVPEVLNGTRSGPRVKGLQEKAVEFKEKGKEIYQKA